MKNILKFKKNKLQHNSGFSLVEVLVACSIISMITLTVMSAASKGIELSFRALKQVQANMIMEEGVEAVKSVRDASWNNIANLPLGNSYLSFNNTWSLSNSNQVEVIDGSFTRTIRLSEVRRDANDDIASSGTVDLKSRKIAVLVSWNSSGQTISKEIDFYLSDIFN